ncbi:hypothetical protein PRNP1_005467 [Phytophthora ramorum]
MEWIILIEFISAGSVSMMELGVPLYSGMMNFSSVNRYLTLSLPSLAASVMPMSICFHRRSRKVKDEWGIADFDLKNEFMTESEKFANDLKEALNSMDSGLELRRPDRSILAETVSSSGHAVNGTRALQASDPSKLIAHYEDVLMEWCDVISTYLETNTTNDGKGNNDQTIDDNGPMGELEYWRR